MENKHYGADYVKKNICKEISPIGIEVANILGQVWRGIYHLENEIKNARTVWSNAEHIEIVIRGNLATWDYDKLTALVILSHDRAVRMEISGASNNYLRLRFHPRERTGFLRQRHPTLEDAIEYTRNAIGLDIK